MKEYLDQVNNERCNEESVQLEIQFKNILQASAGAIGSQDGDAPVFDRHSHERDDIFVSNRRHLLQFFADVLGEIGVLHRDGLDSYNVAFVASRCRVQTLHSQVNS